MDVADIDGETTRNSEEAERPVTNFLLLGVSSQNQ